MNLTNFADFLMEGEKHPDEKDRTKHPNKSVRQGNRLPLKNFKPMERQKKTGHAASDSPTKAEKGAKRKSTVSQPKGHEAAKRNQAYGGESEQQYQPAKYRKITKDLRKAGKGQVNVPRNPPYSAQRRKPDPVVRGADKAPLIDAELKKDDGQGAVRKLINKKLENDFKKKAKGYPKIEEQAMNFTEFCDAIEGVEPLYYAEGKIGCPPGYKFNMKTKRCEPKTPKDSVEPGGGKNSKDMTPDNGPNFRTWGRTGVNGDGYAYEEPNNWDVAYK